MLLKGTFKPGREPLSLYIGGSRIHNKKTTKYLGVRTDEEFSLCGRGECGA